MIGRTLRLPLFDSPRDPVPGPEVTRAQQQQQQQQKQEQQQQQQQQQQLQTQRRDTLRRQARPSPSGNAPLAPQPPSPAGPSGSEAPGAHDSITLGQLKANGPPPAVKQKTQQFDYRYDDTDTIMNELDEFYPYVEMPQIARNPERFEGSFDGVWTESSADKRRAYMEVQLERLESSVVDTRRTAQGRLLYLLQGCFAEVTSPEIQLKWIMENARTLRSVDGIASLVVGLRDAARRYSSISDVPDKTADANMSPCDPYDERSGELMDCLAMLYFVVEVSRTDDSFGQELMAMSPPLPLVLLEMVSALKDRLPKGYPVKKVLLLLWKTLLACLGGIKEIAKARALSRELAGLPLSDKNFTKASPMDITSFRRDIRVKYPTFAPSASSTISVPNEKLADGVKPLPQRTNFHSTEIADTRASGQTTSAQQTQNPQAGQQPPLPGTPAPTPPGSPAPPQPKKKAQYQTDPTRPFVFPYSRHGLGDPMSLVPFAIAEADKLYHRHAYVSLGLYQLWEARENCLREERGLGPSGLIGFSNFHLDDEVDEAAEEALRREWKYEEEEMEATARGDTAGAKAAAEKKAAAKRLHRVEVIYKQSLPILQSCVIVLLKLLLATVTGPGGGAGNTAQPAAGQTHGPDGQPIPEQPAEDLPPPTRAEIDLARHREITSKAVSAILVLLLKWFKASHVLKFHYFAQLLFDSNCLLLVLKMFGLSDVVTSVQARNEWDDWNFFRYCYINYSKNRPDPPPAPFTPKPARPNAPRAAAAGILAPLDSPTKATMQLPSQFGVGAVGQAGAGQAGAAAAAPAPPPPPPPPPTGEPPEVELIGDYSWRNFFTVINFLKVLQKMSKHRGHRTFMLQQYKSSQIMKRMLRVNHPMMQLQVLKLIKSQMPWCGKKWRQTNMKVITAIYLNCRPELRDEWLSGQDQDVELEDALPQEQALRTLISFYNKHNYPTLPLTSPGANGAEPSFRHRRADSTSALQFEGLGGDGGVIQERRPSVSRGRTSSHGSTEDIFPPRRTDSSGTPLPYNPDGMIEFWLHEYEDVLGEVFGEAGEGSGEWDDEYGFGYGYGPGMSPSPRRASYGSSSAERDGAVSPRPRQTRTHSHPHAQSPRSASPRGSGSGSGPGSGPSSPAPSSLNIHDSHRDRDERAWNALGEIMGSRDDDADSISDSESIVTVGELGDDARLDEGGVDEMGLEGGSGDGVFARMQRRRSTENENSWADMATKTLAALPRSPAERRRSSSGQRDSPLRSLLPPAGSGSNRYQEADVFDDEDDADVPGPMPIRHGTQDEQERDFGAVDEVQFAYGE